MVSSSFTIAGLSPAGLAALWAANEFHELTRMTACNPCNLATAFILHVRLQLCNHATHPFAHVTLQLCNHATRSALPVGVAGRAGHRRASVAAPAAENRDEPDPV